MDRAAKLVHGKHLTAYGVTMCEADWARHLGISRATINNRLERGAAIEDALRPRTGNSGPKTTKARVPLSELLVISDARSDCEDELAV